MTDIFDLFKSISSSSPAPAGPVTHIVAGLGNPGDKYHTTRHNAGFLAMDYLSQKANVRVDRLRFKSLTAEATVAGRHVLLLKPQTFMNASGEALAEAAAFYKIKPENILILCDDITQEPGRLRLRAKGSAGGHNGLKSIIERLGSDAFPRLRIGVGAKPHPDYDLADWVLGNFPEADRKQLFEAFGTVCVGVEEWLYGHFDAAQQRCNSFKPTLPPQS
jgi:PTH1 family peptidyl-tRNA hydrolase